MDIIKDSMEKEQLNLRECIDVLKDQVIYLKSDIEFLKTEIINKNSVINRLLDTSKVGNNNDISESRSLTCQVSDNEMDDAHVNNDTIPTDNHFQIEKNRYKIKRYNDRVLPPNFLSDNRYAKLFIDDDSSAKFEKGISENSYNEPIRKQNSTGTERRPHNFINEYPQNDRIKYHLCGHH